MPYCPECGTEICHDGPKTQTGIETFVAVEDTDQIHGVTTDRKPRPGLKRAVVPPARE